MKGFRRALILAAGVLMGLAIAAIAADDGAAKPAGPDPKEIAAVVDQMCAQWDNLARAAKEVETRNHGASPRSGRLPEATAYDVLYLAGNLKEYSAAMRDNCKRVSAALKK